jgi:hypothetical protein
VLTRKSLSRMTANRLAEQVGRLSENLVPKITNLDG